jgi:hypothetical protein
MTERDAGLQPAIVTELHALFEHAIGADRAALADPCARADYGIRTDPCARSDGSALRNLRTRRDAGLDGHGRMEARGDPRVTGIGTRAHQCCHRAFRDHLPRQHDRGRARRRQRAPELRASAEGERAGRGRCQRRDAGHALARIAGKFQSIPDRDLAERHRHRAFPGGCPCLRSWAVRPAPALSPSRGDHLRRDVHGFRRVQHALADHELVAVGARIGLDFLQQGALHAANLFVAAQVQVLLQLVEPARHVELEIAHLALRLDAIGFRHDGCLALDPVALLFERFLLRGNFALARQELALERLLRRPGLRRLLE